MEPLNERCALVTGASSGIGLECARRLVGYGFGRVILTGRSEERLQVAVAELRSAAAATPVPGQVTGMVCDHESRAAIDALVRGITARRLRVSDIVANVGVNPAHSDGPRRAESTLYESFERALRTNVIHTSHLLSGFLGGMRRSGFGRVVLVGSQSYRYGIPGQIPYNTSKAALVGVMRTLSSEYGAFGLRFTLVNPGAVATARWDRLRRRHFASARLIGAATPEATAARIVEVLLDESGRFDGVELEI